MHRARSTFGIVPIPHWLDQRCAPLNPKPYTRRGWRARWWSWRSGCNVSCPFHMWLSGTNAARP